MKTHWIKLKFLSLFPAKISFHSMLYSKLNTRRNEAKVGHVLGKKEVPGGGLASSRSSVRKTWSEPWCEYLSSAALLLFFVRYFKRRALSGGGRGEGRGK